MCVDSMIQWKEEEKEKDSTYIQRIIRENFDVSPLRVTCHRICNNFGVTVRSGMRSSIH